MSATDFLGLWLHILAVVAYGGATLAVVVMVIPAANGAADAASRRSILVRALRIYDPLAIAVLGIVVMTGASNLTTYKAAMRGAFFERVGWLLVCKLSLAFMVIMVGTYITFGLAHRIVRAEGLGDPPDDAWLTSMTRRLSIACILSLVLLALTVWLGLELGHPSMYAIPPA
ncbi:MAG: CopD family protein [Deltaproteobacteria bacterium]|nr:CopD family protein [Deltaproteobacteria bacterium]